MNVVIKLIARSMIFPAFTSGRAARDTAAS